MENRKENIPMAELMPIIESAFKSNKPVEITVTGNSMRPLLLDRISSVKLTKPDDLIKGDIVLFLRHDGHYVLHRISNIHGGLYDIVGDNQSVPDKNIPKEKIMAKVVGYSRKGKHWKEQDDLYRFILPVIKTVRRYGYGIKRRLALFT